MQEILRDIRSEVDVEQVPDGDTVLIHDVARPLLTTKMVDDCYEAFDGHDGIMTVLPLYGNIYRTKEDGWTIEITSVDSCEP
jgi:2-C-methyl-D-erythritol 4-phosphate cytidylyltransferase